MGEIEFHNECDNNNEVDKMDMDDEKQHAQWNSMTWIKLRKWMKI